MHITLETRFMVKLWFSHIKDAATGNWPSRNCVLMFMLMFLSITQMFYHTLQLITLNKINYFEVLVYIRLFKSLNLYQTSMY